MEGKAGFNRQYEMFIDKLVWDVPPVYAGKSRCRSTFGVYRLEKHT
jgi:hypothetical protein